MTVHAADPHTFYNDADLRAIDRGLPTYYNGAHWTVRDGWVDYIVDRKDLEPYVDVDLSYKDGFFRRFPHPDKKKTEALWNSLKRFAEKTGDGDAVLSGKEIAPIHTRVYEIAWRSLYPGVQLKDHFLEFPPELTPIKFDSFDSKQRLNTDGFVEGRHGIDIEKLAIKAMAWRLKHNGLPRETEITTVYVGVGKIEAISLDRLEKKNESRADKPGPWTDAVTFSLGNDNEIKPIPGLRWDERDAIWPWPLFRIKEHPTRVITDIIQNYYDPAMRWEQSGKMVFYVPPPVSGPRTIIVVEPKEGIIKQRDSEGELMRIEESQDPWEYDNFLFSHGLPFPLVHYLDQLPALAQTASFMEEEGWEHQDGNTYKFVIHNRAVPTETAELYFDKWEYQLAGYRANGRTVSFGDSLHQDPESKIRYPSKKGSGVLVIDKGKESSHVSTGLTASDISMMEAMGQLR